MSNYKNLASTVLENSGQTTDTSITMPSTTAALFPTPPFYATIMPTNSGLANGSNSEIVEVTAATTSGANTIFSISRAQRGTSAISWDANEAILSHAIYTQDMPFIDDVLSTPSSVAYVATDNIQTSAVTTPKIADGAVTSDKIDSATLDLSAITPAQGYSIANLVISKKGGVVYFNGSIGIPQITSIDNQTSVFTIPAGWRPVSTMNFVVVSFNGASPVPLARVRITADGTLKISKIDQDLTASSYVQVASVSYVAN